MKMANTFDYSNCLPELQIRSLERKTRIRQNANLIGKSYLLIAQDIKAQHDEMPYEDWVTWCQIELGYQKSMSCSLLEIGIELLQHAGVELDVNFLPSSYRALVRIASALSKMGDDSEKQEFLGKVKDQTETKGKTLTEKEIIKVSKPESVAEVKAELAPKLPKWVDIPLDGEILVGDEIIYQFGSVRPDTAIVQGIGDTDFYIKDYESEVEYRCDREEILNISRNLNYDPENPTRQEAWQEIEMELILQLRKVHFTPKVEEIEESIRVYKVGERVAWMDYKKSHPSEASTEVVEFGEVIRIDGINPRVHPDNPSLENFYAPNGSLLGTEQEVIEIQNLTLQQHAIAPEVEDVNVQVGDIQPIEEDVNLKVDDIRPIEQAIAPEVEEIEEDIEPIFVDPEEYLIIDRFVAKSLIDSCVKDRSIGKETAAAIGKGIEHLTPVTKDTLTFLVSVAVLVDELTHCTAAQILGLQLEDLDNVLREYSSKKS